MKQRLHQRRGTWIHVIDPFKIPVEEAVEKAMALAERDYPAVILGSTDYVDFDGHMPCYIDAIKSAVDIPLILHFPPRKGQGLPLAAKADAQIFPALLGAEDPYFVWKSFLETIAVQQARGLHPRDFPELIFSAGLTFGADDISRGVMSLQPIDMGSLRRLASFVETLGLDLVYLYSRYEGVPPEACRQMRELLSIDRLVFVSGRVTSRQQVQEYLEAGADYVAFAGALEVENWRDCLSSFG